MKIRATILFFLVLASAMLTVAQSKDIDIPYQRFVLSNGLTLLVHEDHKAPIVAVNVWYHVGSKNEKPGKTGFAHLFEHLMFGGSEHLKTRYIDAIRNSSLSRVEEVHQPTGPEWTHVWEQEFATLDGLTGPYMMHGYHWSFIDTWFDRQSPRHIVDPVLIHSACALRHSILARA